MSSGKTIANSQHAKVINVTSKTWTLPNPATVPAGKIQVYYDNTTKKEKKMGWFRRKFMEWSQRAWEDGKKELHHLNEVRPHEGVSGKSSVRFTVYAASGGHIIEYYKQDRYRDSEGPELVIVSTGDSLGTAVEHILTLEALKS
jgi:hypothetical protein